MAGRVAGMFERGEVDRCVEDSRALVVDCHGEGGKWNEELEGAMGMIDK